MDIKELESSYKKLYSAIESEHHQVFERQDLDGVARLMKAVEAADQVFLMGVGREGIAARSFAMRLMHLGKASHWIWDDTTPGMHEGDLFICVNGSGDISHINCVLENAVRTGASTFAITGSRKGRAAAIAGDCLFVPATVYKGTDDVVPSIQPMGNLFEQHLFMLFDIIVMLLEKEMKVDNAEMSRRHRNIE